MLSQLNISGLDKVQVAIKRLQLLNHQKAIISLSVEEKIHA